MSLFPFARGRRARLPGRPSGRTACTLVLPVPPAGLRRGLGRNDAHGPAAVERTELHQPADQREQRVVAAAAYAVAGVEMRAVLADDDLARVHELAARALDAEALGLRGTAVWAGVPALLVVRPSPPPP